MEHPWHKFYAPGVAAEVDIDQFSSIREMLDDAFARFPEREAVICIDESLTYRQMDQLSDQFADYLQNTAGLKKGDRLAIMLPNTFQFALTFIAAQKIGLVTVNVNPLYTTREMRHQFIDSGVQAIVILDMFTKNLAEVIDDTKITHVVSTNIGEFLPLWKRAAVKTIMNFKGLIPKTNLNSHSFKEALKLGKKGQFTRPPIDRNEISLLQYTGGTTGVSKGAMLTHRNVLACIAQLEEWAKDFVTEEQETVLTALPLYHIFALSVNFLSFLKQGQRVVLLPRPIPIRKSVVPFKKYEISTITGVNTLFNSMVKDELFLKLRPRCIKYAIAGGMALQESVAKEWEEITGIPIIEGYGLTEAPVVSSNPLNGNARLGTIGVPIPSTEVKVVDEQGKEQPLGTPGELIVRGPQVMVGYWNKAVETAETIRDGWLWTGDVAVMDDDGFFRIVDRKKDMILVSGFNVFPNEIEEVLASHPKIFEAAVIGVPHPKSGEAIKAFYVASDPSVTPVELEKFCRKNLTPYKIPQQWEKLDELPKSNVGKILRRELRGEPQASETTNEQRKLAA